MSNNFQSLVMFAVGLIVVSFFGLQAMIMVQFNVPAEIASESVWDGGRIFLIMLFAGFFSLSLWRVVLAGFPFVCAMALRPIVTYHFDGQYVLSLMTIFCLLCIPMGWYIHAHLSK